MYKVIGWHGMCYRGNSYKKIATELTNLNKLLIKTLQP